jgi:hypothetical protein
VAWAGAPRRAAGPEGAFLILPVAVAGRAADVWFRVAGDGPGDPGRLSDTGDPALTALLLPAMALGEPVELEPAVSPRLLAGTDRLQDIFRVWVPRRFARVAVSARPRQVTPPPGRGVACFFSGGVDSTYSVLKHRERLAALILVHGWDLLLDQRPFRRGVATVLRQAAGRFGLPLIEVETNIHPWRADYVRWRWYFGAALACVALALSPLFAEVLIPSSEPYSKLHPWGSHALTDPLWSTEATELVHDGAEATRLEKVRRLAGSPGALESLRVCFENPNGAYNCGRCEKCLRTMIALRAVEALDRCPTFPPLDLEAVAALTIPSPLRLSEYTDSLEAVERHGRDAALARALRACVARTPGGGAGAAAPPGPAAGHAPDAR